MTRIANRVARLERAMTDNGKGRVITVRSHGGSESDAEAFLLNQGIILDHQKDQLVHFRTVYLDRQGNPDTPSDYGLELMNITEMRR